MVFLIDLKYEDCKLTLQELLLELKIDYNAYKEALSISQKGQVVVMKRSINDRYVNNYNSCFIKAMKSNIDIQFVSDLHAVTTYVTDYFSKDDEGLTKLMKEALKESADCDGFTRLNHLKKIYFTQTSFK